MTILDQLTSLMLEKVEVTPVPKQELDDFLSQNNIDICDEHYQLLLNYGNSGFLKYGYADFTFDYLKIAYYDNEDCEEEKLPDNCNYIGRDISADPLCIDFETKEIYLYSYGEKDLLCYSGIDELLLFSLFKLMENKYFDKVKENIKIDDVDKFRLTYSNYEIKDITIYNRYFFKDNVLITTNNNFYYYNLYQGGILDKIIDDR
ncbi:hypothetical protein [Moraxella oculi]|uniref:SMI1/KNR4 family protein n=1 Tax=Moraxella oculi TaxID=2940516 RepID=A0ABW8U9A8_9GAMM